MKNRLILLILTVLTLSACDPETKEQYLIDYKEFIDRVEEGKESYSFADWEDAKKDFKKFSVRLYDEFKGELSLKEKMLCAKYQVQFNMYRLKHELSTFKEEDLEELKDSLEYYYENDMQDDIEMIKKQSKHISKDLQELIEDLIDELEEKYEETK